jgi:hypothetical protein
MGGWPSNDAFAAKRSKENFFNRRKRMRFVRLLIAGLLLSISSVVLAQDDLIDDLPKERKEAPKAVNRRTKKKADQPTLQPQPKTDLTDDLSPEQKQVAAERPAARKAESSIPDNLADALSRALHNSPTISLAEAKVRQAQAELYEARIGVVRDVTLAMQRRAYRKSLLEKYNVPEAIDKVREQILEDEGQIMYLLGIGAEPHTAAPHSPSAGDSQAGPGAMGMMMRGMGMGMGGAMGGPGGGMMAGGMGGGGMMGGGMGGGGMAPGGMMGGSMGPAGGSMQSAMMGMMGGGSSSSATTSAKSESSPPDKLQKSLQSRVDLDFTEQPLGDVLDYLSQAAEVTFVRKQKDLSSPVTASLRQVPLEVALQAIADLTDYCFVFRDYGILVINRNQAHSYLDAGIPLIGPGTPLVHP